MAGTLADLGQIDQPRQPGVSLSDLMDAIMRNPQVRQTIMQGMEPVPGRPQDRMIMAPSERVRQGFGVLGY